VIAESIPERAGTRRMGLDRNDASPGRDERRRERANAGANVYDEDTRRNTCVSDEPVRPSSVELMPPPPPR
jgi:hypothetical protein